MSLKPLLLFLCVAACANDGQSADRIALDTVPMPPAVDSYRPPVDIRQSPESVTAREIREMTSRIDSAVPEIVRVPPDAFPEVPANVRAELTNLGCLIPQPFDADPHPTSQRPARKPTNIVNGKFAAPNQDDWAALCSISDTSMIVIVWGGPVRCPSPIERGADRGWMQGIGNGKFGFSRAIGVATIAYIDQHAEWYGGRAPPVRDHDGINHAFVEKASTVLFCHQGKWLELQGAD